MSVGICSVWNSNALLVGMYDGRALLECSLAVAHKVKHTLDPVMSALYIPQRNENMSVERFVYECS